ncbi:MAG: lysostaphin resistance A-like protein [Planctomycetaceae bacterium]
MADSPSHDPAPQEPLFLSAAEFEQNRDVPPPSDAGEPLWIGEEHLAPPLSPAYPPPQRHWLLVLLESLAWWCSLPFLQILGGGLAAAIVVIVFLVETGGGPDALQALQKQDELEKILTQEYLLEFLCITQAVVVLGTMLLAPLRLGWRRATLPRHLLAPWEHAQGFFKRLGRETLRQMPLAPIPWPHGGLILLAVLPLQLVAATLYAAVAVLWEELVKLLPWLRGLDDVNTMESIGEMVQSGSLVFVILALAVAPAIGEELIFRGVIGRGLIARFGLLAGMLTTSVLFGAAHIHPVHAIGVVPLGLAMHFAYYCSRSFWAPMLIHFLNNGFAVLVTKYLPEAAEMEEVDRPLWLVAIAAVTLAAMALLMWRTRVRHELPDGTAWDPGYDTVESPPPGVPAIRMRDGLMPGPLMPALFATLAFYAGLTIPALLEYLRETGTLD